jgi:hypothetical protein
MSLTQNFAYSCSRPGRSELTPDVSREETLDQWTAGCSRLKGAEDTSREIVRVPTDFSTGNAASTGPQVVPRESGT